MNNTPPCVQTTLYLSRTHLWVSGCFSYSGSSGEHCQEQSCGSFVWTELLGSPACIQRNRVTLMLKVFSKWPRHWTFLPALCEFPVSPRSRWALSPIFLVYTHPSGREVVPTVVLHFLRKNDAGHLFMSLLAFCKFSFEKYLQVIGPFLNWMVSYPWDNLYVPDTGPLSPAYFGTQWCLHWSIWKAVSKFSVVTLLLTKPCFLC